MRKIRIIILTAILIVLANICTANFYLPVNQPEYRFIYDGARRYEITRGFYYDNFLTGPYNTKTLTYDFPLAEYFDSNTQDRLRLFVNPAEDYRVGKYSRAEAIEILRGGFMASPYRNVSLYFGFLVNEAWGKDPNYSGKKWRGLAGEVEHGFIAYQNNQLQLLFGRFGSFQGPIIDNLIVSGEARPMDGFAFRYHWGKLHYSYHLARLDSYDTLLVGETIIYNRYFANHRLDIRLWENLNAGLFESIIFGGKNRTLEFSYLNPFNIYHTEQLNENRDDNTLIGFDLVWYLNNRHRIYGQLVIDDFQIEDKEPGDQEPNEIGYLIGFETQSLFDLVDLHLKYMRITNRTYNQVNFYNRYENRGEPIGNSFGPDGEIFEIQISHWLQFKRRLHLRFDYQRKGEGNIDDEWIQPWLVSDGDYSEPFPTGLVQKRFTMAIGFSGFFRDIIFVDTEGGLADYRNYRHLQGFSRTIPYFKIYISAFLSASMNID